MKFSIEQLKLAAELCFKEDAELLFRKHFPEVWCTYLYDFVYTYDRDLMRWVFSWSRRDLSCNELGSAVDAIIRQLLGIPVVEEEVHNDTVYVLEELQENYPGGKFHSWVAVGCTYDKAHALEWENEDYDNRCVTPVSPLPPPKNPKETL